MTDPVSDFLIRLKNAGAARREVVLMPYSNLKNSIGVALLKIGFVGSVVKHQKESRRGA